MKEFVDEHEKAGRIRRSSSHIAAGTWMIPKDDPTAMPRVVHDYSLLGFAIAYSVGLICRED